MCGGAVYDGYHYASDVVAGALIGIAVGLVFVSLQVTQTKALPKEG
jgi:membrane-associated phospholipid phosphatase